MPDLGTSAEVTSLHAQLAREEACRASVASVLAVKILVTDATLKRVSAVTGSAPSVRRCGAEGFTSSLSLIDVGRSSTRPDRRVRRDGEDHRGPLSQACG